MSERTTQYNKLSRLIEALNDYEYPGLENIDIPISHIVPFLLQIQERLGELEMALLKMDSAFRTNPLTGDKKVYTILQILLKGREENG